MNTHHSETLANQSLTIEDALPAEAAQPQADLAMLLDGSRKSRTLTEHMTASF